MIKLFVEQSLASPGSAKWLVPTGNDWKWLDIAITGWKWLKIAGNGLK